MLVVVVCFLNICPTDVFIANKIWQMRLWDNVEEWLGKKTLVDNNICSFNVAAYQTS